MPIVDTNNPHAAIGKVYWFNHTLLVTRLNFPKVLPRFLRHNVLLWLALLQDLTNI
jgi:hypothetical protein